MTIYKPKLADEKAKHKAEKQLKTYDDDLSDENPFIQEDAVEILGQTAAVSLRQRRVFALNCFTVIVSSMVIALTVLGVTYFSIVHLRHSDVNKPWMETCRVRYHEWLTDTNGKNFLEEGEIYQQVEIDVTKERYEKLSVPSVSNTKRALVVHDMELGLSAVVDQDHGRCFVGRINATLVKPISDFYNLLENNKAGYYLPDAELIHENFAIAHPPIADILSEFGPRIMSECQFFDTYRLVRDDLSLEKKAVTPCRYQNDRYCMGNAGSKFMLIFTISRCI